MTDKLPDEPAIRWEWAMIRKPSFKEQGALSIGLWEPYAAVLDSDGTQVLWLKRRLCLAHGSGLVRMAVPQETAMTTAHRDLTARVATVIHDFRATRRDSRLLAKEILTALAPELAVVEAAWSYRGDRRAATYSALCDALAALGNEGETGE